MDIQDVVSFVVVAPPGDKETGQQFDSLVCLVLGKGLEVYVLPGRYLPDVRTGQKDETAHLVTTAYSGDKVFRAFVFHETGTGRIVGKGSQGQFKHFVFGQSGQDGNDFNPSVVVRKVRVAYLDDFFVLAYRKVPVIVDKVGFFHLLRCLNPNTYWPVPSLPASSENRA